MARIGEAQGTKPDPWILKQRWLWVGLVTAVALMAAAVVVPGITHWRVHVMSFAPLHAEWRPRVGPGTIPAIILALVAVVFATKTAASWPWKRLLLGSFVLGAAWLISLATVDGWAGIGHIFDTGYEYLQTARTVSDVPATLRVFTSRIADGPNIWPVHIGAHPPGALLFFVFLVRIGLGSGLAAGFVVLLLAATTPVAVLITLRRLGAEDAARRAAPFLVMGSAAIWMAVSADAMFGAFAAWGLCCLAFAATSRSTVATAVWGIAAGLLLGYCVMLSYGLALLGILALAVLLVARNWRPLPWAVVAAVAVVGTFALEGFAWWDAYPLLRERYYSGVASKRPQSYWIWGDLAALCFSAGPILGASVAATVSRVARRANSALHQDRPVVLLVTAALVTVLAADLSGMSKAEVERIWLPFVPWLLVGTALLPIRWRRVGLAGQIVFALVVQHLLFTGW